MPNISVKMLAGRTQAQKEKLAKDLVEVLSHDLGAVSRRGLEPVRFWRR